MLVGVTQDVTKEEKQISEGKRCVKSGGSQEPASCDESRGASVPCAPACGDTGERDTLSQVCSLAPWLPGSLVCADTTTVRVTAVGKSHRVCAMMCDLLLPARIYTGRKLALAAWDHDSPSGLRSAQATHAPPQIGFALWRESFHGGRVEAFLPLGLWGP